MRLSLVPYTKGVAAVGSSVETASGGRCFLDGRWMGWHDGGIPTEVGMQKKSQSGEKDERVLIPYVDCRHWNRSTLL